MAPRVAKRTLRFKEPWRRRLRADEAPPVTRREWPRHALVAASAAVVMGVLISVPAVRASVAQFLSLFPLVHFVAVPVDESRIDRLQGRKPRDRHAHWRTRRGGAGSGSSRQHRLDRRRVGRYTRVLETSVVGQRVLRVTANRQRLQQVMDAFGISDLTVPPGLDGHVVNVRVPPVAIRFEHGKRRSRLFQARTPQLTLPASIDVKALGEIGLRILGDDRKH